MANQKNACACSLCQRRMPCHSSTANLRTSCTNFVSEAIMEALYIASNPHLIPDMPLKRSRNEEHMPAQFQWEFLSYSRFMVLILFSSILFKVQGFVYITLFSWHINQMLLFVSGNGHKLIKLNYIKPVCICCFIVHEVTFLLI